MLNQRKFTIQIEFICCNPINTKRLIHLRLRWLVISTLYLPSMEVNWMGQCASSWDVPTLLYVKMCVIFRFNDLKCLNGRKWCECMNNIHSSIGNVEYWHNAMDGYIQFIARNISESGCVPWQYNFAIRKNERFVVLSDVADSPSLLLSFSLQRTNHTFMRFWTDVHKMRTTFRLAIATEAREHNSEIGLH